MAPYYADLKIAIVGPNTARSFTFKDGRINQQNRSRKFARASSAWSDNDRTH